MTQTKAWSRVFGQAAKQTRPFNYDLIYGYRRDKISKIPEFLDKMFVQVMEFFNGQMTYRGYRALTPEERIAYIIDNQITRGSWSIRDTAAITMRISVITVMLPSVTDV